jgi:hypothetical protein
LYERGERRRCKRKRQRGEQDAGCKRGVREKVRKGWEMGDWIGGRKRKERRGTDKMQKEKRPQRESNP